MYVHAQRQDVWKWLSHIYASKISRFNSISWYFLVNYVCEDVRKAFQYPLKLDKSSWHAKDPSSLLCRLASSHPNLGQSAVPAVIVRHNWCSTHKQKQQNNILAVLLKHFCVFTCSYSTRDLLLTSVNEIIDPPVCNNNNRSEFSRFCSLYQGLGPEQDQPPNVYARIATCPTSEQECKDWDFSKRMKFACFFASHSVCGFEDFFFLILSIYSSILSLTLNIGIKFGYECFLGQILHKWYRQVILARG